MWSNIIPLIKLVLNGDIISFGFKELLWCNVVKPKGNADQGNITDTLGRCLMHHMISHDTLTFSSHVFNPSVVNMSIRWSWAMPQSSATFSTSKNNSVKACIIWGSGLFACWLSSSVKDHVMVTWHKPTTSYHISSTCWCTVAIEALILLTPLFPYCLQQLKKHGCNKKYNRLAWFRLYLTCSTCWNTKCK